MVTERAETHGSPSQDAPLRSSDRDSASVMEAAISRMGGDGIIAVTSADTEQTVGERFRSIITKLLTDHSKQPLQIYHWMPAADYKPITKKRKNTALHVTIDGQAMVGVPYPHSFPSKGGASDLMIIRDEGKVSFLQFLRTLSAKPGHTVTFSRGELHQVDFTYQPSVPLQRSEPASLMPEQLGVPAEQPVRSPVRTAEKKKRKSRMGVPHTIALFFMLAPVDQEDILSRMDEDVRASIEKGFFRDAQGVHRRPNSDLGMDPGTWYGRMQTGVQFIHERVREGPDGSVRRVLTELEHGRKVFKIAPVSAVTDMPETATDFRGKRRKKKGGKRGWLKA